ncbi:MAG: hypothetical protein PGN15_15040 [Aeromicrobium erythreum]
MRPITTALAGALALSLLAAPAQSASAQAAPHTDTGRDGSGAVRTVGLELDTDDATLERALAALSAATTPTGAQAALEDTLGGAAVIGLAEEVGAPSDALFGEEVQTLKKRSFMQCMKARVGKDIRSIFNVNAIAALIGREKYLEAAKAAVKYLAKQGVKRNAAGLAATLAYYAARCKLFG